jgi:hypothetical protein
MIPLPLLKLFAGRRSFSFLATWGIHSLTLALHSHRRTEHRYRVFLALPGLLFFGDVGRVVLSS